MATSTLRFYTVAFDREDNPRIDNLEGYLVSIDEPLRVDNFQYIRHDLSIKIKVDWPQIATDDFEYNYLAIDQTDTTFYYYIDFVKQMAQSTLELDLSMDVVNSLVDPREFTNETEIYRQHGDRFKKPTAWNPTNGGYLARRIDRPSEGIVVQKTLLEANKYRVAGPDGLDWYLIYQNSYVEDPEHPELENPILTFVCASESILVRNSFNNYVTLYGINDVYDDEHGAHITAWDRTDSRLIKIIKLPYCPLTYTKTVVSPGVVGYVFPEDWNMMGEVGKLMYGKSTLPSFDSVRISAYGFSALMQYFGQDEITVHDTPVQGYESKLNHSDFYTPKLVYDSFSLAHKLELWELKSDVELPDDYPAYEIQFKPTSTINSKFGFKIIPRNYSMLTGFTGDEDFSQLLLVSRNNEELLMNSAYINYIKNGYNYEKKANALAMQRAQNQANFSGINTAVSTLATMASLALAPSTGGASLMGLVGVGASAVGSGVNAASSWQSISDLQSQQDNSIAAKVAQLAAQSANTSGSDDVDLMSWYSDNKLWQMHYTMSALDRQTIYRMLWNTGYNHHTFDTPDVDSRIWFNYIKCNPHIERKYYLGKKKESWMQALKRKYVEGVTVYHEILGEWDFDKQYENYESWVAFGIPR